MTWVYIGVAAVSTAVTVAGQQEAKRKMKAAAAERAEQQREAARRVRAISQRESAQEREHAKRVGSALQARAMGGGSDTGIARLEAEIYGEGELRALMALYEGDIAGLGMERGADATIKGARARATAYNYESAGTILQAAGKMYGVYSDKPPPTTSAGASATWSDKPTSSDGSALGDPYYMGG